MCRERPNCAYMCATPSESMSWAWQPTIGIIYPQLPHPSPSFHIEIFEKQACDKLVTNSPIVKARKTFGVFYLCFRSVFDHHKGSPWSARVRTERFVISDQCKMIFGRNLRNVWKSVDLFLSKFAKKLFRYFCVCSCRYLFDTGIHIQIRFYK